MTAATVAPPIPYFGSKQRLAGRLVELFPPHEHYVEPFGGSLSVLLAKAPSRMETVNDLDRHVMTFWRVLRDRPDDLARVCALTPHSRAEYAASRDFDVDDDLEHARRVWVQLAQGRAGHLMRTGWRQYVDPAGSSIGMPGYLAAYVDRIAPAAARLAHVSLECMPALDIIDRYGTAADVLLYLDPPYLGNTRGTTSAYRHEMRHEAEHVELAEHLHAARAASVLSGYPSPLYDHLYADWHRTDLASWTGQGNKGPFDGARTEVLWSNVPLDTHPTLDFGATA